MRRLWTSGVTDVMMEHGVWPDGLIGVSAGAAFGCNYKSRQAGRAIRYNTRFANDARYSGVRSLLLSGDYFNARSATTWYLASTTSLIPLPLSRTLYLLL